MNILFLVVLPLATILIAIVLQNILRSPILVAVLAFAVYLILTFTAFTTEFLINTMLYALLAYITAVLFRFICCLRRRMNCPTENTCGNSGENETRNLENSIDELQNSISELENNIDNLAEILSNAIGNNAGCHRRIR